MKDMSAEVDRYIENAPPFAQPILKKIRKAVHAGDPDVVETIKWGVPFFDHKGIIVSMAAFKEHVRWGFWKGKLIGNGAATMGETKIADLSELPPEKEIIACVREAVRLNEEGIKKAAPTRKAKPEAKVPTDLAAALKKSPKAAKTFQEFPPSHRREYVEWIDEAKQDATRQKRIAQTVEWLEEGKARNWKYMRK